MLTRHQDGRITSSAWHGSNRCLSASRRQKLVGDGVLSSLTAMTATYRSDFIDFGESNKILLAIFPPHATHSLQPLDVVLFAPLSCNYSRELDRYLQRSQGLVAVKKRDFFSIFWPARSSTISPDSIRKSFQATGVWPKDAHVILQRFNNHTSEQDKASKLGEHGNSDS